jgi:hypothetical protein
MALICCPECESELNGMAEVCPACKRKLPNIVKDLLREKFGEIKEDTPRQNKGLYFFRHWRGELGLAVSYWINIFLLSIAIRFGLIALASHIDQAQQNIRLLFFVYFLSFASFIFIIYPWQIIGTWRSANAHIQRTKKYFWAVATKFAIVLGMLGTLGQLPNYFPQLKEYWKIAFEIDNFSKKEFSLLQNGEELVVSGGISFGLTEEVREIYKTNPGIKIIRLDSFGGRVKEARFLRDFIKENNLITYSSSGCLSACTIPFLAGSQRILNQKAKLGFHQYSFPGFTEEQFKEAYQQEKKFMIALGVDPKFSEKAFTAASDDMWYPSHAELLSANVVTRITVGQEFGSTLPKKATDLAKLEEHFLSIPLYKDLREYEPDIFQALISDAKLKFSQGASEQEIINYLKKHIVKMVEKRLPIAPDKELVAYTRIMVAEIRELTAKDPHLCFQMLFPEKFGPINLSDHISKETQTAELAALSTLIQSSARTPHKTPGKAEIAKYLDPIFLKLHDIYGEKVLYFDDPDNSKVSKKDACHMIADVYDLILTLHDAQSGPTLRHMFAQK